MLDFVDTALGMFEFELNPGLNWMPVVEKSGCQEKFLTEDPFKAMLNGHIHRVPLITGITEYEFYYGAYGKIHLQNTQKNII